MQTRKRYALVGTGIRSRMYRDAIVKTFPGTCELVAICDTNPLRMQAWQDELGLTLPTYAPADFEKMIREHRVDVVIVTSVDRTHHEYLCRAMEAGCDVITEKPLTVDAEKCRQILDTRTRTGRRLTVGFNYRYAPRNAKVKELLRSGVIGDVVSVHFEWVLDTQHGADYFRRWHRDKRNSGGLLVHKSTHHFDLMNWWLDSRPETVMAMGDLRFYGRENAEARGETHAYARGTGSAAAAGDPFALDLSKEPDLKRFYLDCEAADGYQRDQNVFGDGISIEDDMSVLVRYRNRAVMTYHLVAFAPWEGYRIAFNGTKGRLEFDVTERASVQAGEADANLARNIRGSAPHEIVEPVTLLVRPHWGAPVRIDIPETSRGGHGGADELLLEDLFSGKAIDDPLGRAAGHEDGAWSIMAGVAANRSIQTGLPVHVREIAPWLG
jgi:Predicted dehydrogenases and related proteins